MRITGSAVVARRRMVSRSDCLLLVVFLAGIGTLAIEMVACGCWRPRLAPPADLGHRGWPDARLAGHRLPVG